MFGENYTTTIRISFTNAQDKSTWWCKTKASSPPIKSLGEPRILLECQCPSYSKGLISK
ncbi:hypothetical protein OIU77_024504 [Salix suchowensis]|uniref:Uncharacterized protein n=1 Tax=Salix suchowensis TaxID=1278906 RepID=A0ABQ9BT52_9ROSI|nr:hypothetical protein OIU77_024504 [Salix suchowensis]